MHPAVSRFRLGTLAAWLWAPYALFIGDAGVNEMRMEFNLIPSSGGGAKDVAILDDTDAERRIPVDQLQIGDRFAVRPGEKVATDGIVEDGNSAADMSMLTGESVPVEVSPGTEVAGATVNAGGRLIVRATRVGSDTALAFWLGTGQSATFAFTAAVAVLIIACPCALGLATPTALMVGTGRGAQLGLLIESPEVLGSTRRADTIVLDKTGAVTTGKMSLTEMTVADGVDAGEALRLDIWWLVDAPGPDQALAQLPFFVAERSTVTEIREVHIP